MCLQMYLGAEGKESEDISVSFLCECVFVWFKGPGVYLLSAPEPPDAAAVPFDVVR